MEWKTSTLTIHQGEKFHPEGVHTIPIFQTGTFSFSSIKEAQKVFSGEKEGFIYTRVGKGNPNFVVVEEKIAALEKAETALLFGSGMAAINIAIQALVKAGGHFIATQTLYGCTWELFRKILPQLQIFCTLIDTRDPELIKKSIQRNTKAIFIETPANPTLDLADISALAEIAKENGLYLIVDNSFASPYNQRALELGADLVVHSSTKYLNGHGDLISGVICGKREILRERKSSLEEWRGLTGPIPSPFDCWLLRIGLLTFEARMKIHNFNAQKLAQFLEQHPRVKKVIYPGLPSHPQYDLAKKQMTTPEGELGGGGMIAFELWNQEKTTQKFFEKIIQSKIVDLAVSLGYIETLIQWPAFMTHFLISPEERKKKLKISDGLIRLSVGIENYADLEATFKKALDNLD